MTKSSPVLTMAVTDGRVDHLDQAPEQPGGPHPPGEGRDAHVRGGPAGPRRLDGAVRRVHGSYPDVPPVASPP